jgi:hypothetical protein
METIKTKEERSESIGLKVNDSYSGGNRFESQSDILTEGFSYFLQSPYHTMLYSLVQWSSSCGTQRHLRGYARTSYINQNETQKPLEP